MYKNIVKKMYGLQSEACICYLRPWEHDKNVV